MFSTSFSLCVQAFALGQVKLCLVQTPRTATGQQFGICLRCVDGWHPHVQISRHEDRAHYFLGS